MEKKWTPGPWGKESFALSEEILAPGNKLVAIVQSRHCDSPEEMRANAHIIAAAPELYEALLGIVECKRMTNLPNKRQYQVAISAIAKARGETGERGE